MNEKDLLLQEEEMLETSISSTEKLSLLSNIICLKRRITPGLSCYKDLKRLICYYIEVIKDEKYGYDSVNLEIFDELIKPLSFNEKEQILLFTITAFSRELPEFDKKFLFDRQLENRYKKIFCEKSYLKFPYAILVYSGASFKRVLVFLLLVFLSYFIILLPAPFPSWRVFEIQYESYSNKFLSNHFFNLVSLLLDMDNDLKVKPLNGWGFLLIFSGKVIFITIGINFLFRKLSEQINIK